VRVLIADDHPLIREGIRATLERLPFVSQTRSVETHREVVAAIADETWDLVVMDLDMPEGDPLNTLAQIKARAPEMPVLVVSVHPEDSYALRVLRAGATGYLHKSSAVDHLETAVRRMRSGRRYVSAELAEQLLDAFEGDEEEAPHAALSDREMQVLCGLASGKSVGDVAGELGLSPKTVSTYRARVFEKLDFDSIAELVRYAVEYDLVS